MCLHTRALVRASCAPDVTAASWAAWTADECTACALASQHSFTLSRMDRTNLKMHRPAPVDKKFLVRFYEFSHPRKHPPAGNHAGRGAATPPRPPPLLSPLLLLFLLLLRLLPPPRSPSRAVRSAPPSTTPAWRDQAHPRHPTAAPRLSPQSARLHPRPDLFNMDAIREKYNTEAGNAKEAIPER